LGAASKVAASEMLGAAIAVVLAGMMRRMTEDDGG
jgi:hypothetical protein